MANQLSLPKDTARQLAWPLRLTLWGMGAERVVRSFWPLASVVMATLAALMFGLQDVLPLEAVWALAVVSVSGGLWALIHGLRRFRLPRRAEALLRLDAALPGRPIAALTDRQVIGQGDAASEAVWQAHIARMADRARAARAVEPDLKVARRDPFALRYVALLALVMAGLFGSVWRVATVADMTPGAVGLAAEGTAWEGWIEPPLYTGKPSLYLADVPPGPLTVPAGSKLSVRLYGTVGKLIVEETVSARTGEVTGASDPVQEFEIVQGGTIAIRGPGGAEWQVSVLDDAPPAIMPEGEPSRTVAGEMRQDFTATDDYGVVAGRALIDLDLAAADRRYGLAAAPEPREPIAVDLPLTVSGDRANFTETLAENFAEHPWAGLPVTLVLEATDAAGQVGRSEASHVILPGRRFFDTMAMALIEMRRDLLWNRSNAPRAMQILRAVSNRPDEAFRDPGPYLQLRTLIRRTEAALADGPLADDVRDATADRLWQIAVLIEDGNLSDALERLRRAQDRLAEAIRNGATDQEIAELMDELRRAMDDYMRQLAENADPSDQDQAQNGEQQTITGDQLEQMLQRLQELMEQGRTAEAQALLDQLRRMMENMQVTRGPGGQQSPGQQAMEGLSDTLRQQQELSDDTFGDLQQQFGQQDGQGQQGQPRQPGQQGQQGQQGQGRGQQGQGQQGGAGQMLADRQQALRDLLSQQQGNLPGGGSPEGDAARDALDRAGRAMDDAENALRDGDLSGALNDQAQAMEALREGMRDLGQMMANRQQDGQGRNGNALGNADPNNRRDPLGRDQGANGRIGTDEQLLQGDDVYRRARDLLDEIRRRSSDQERPSVERDYLRRLLDRF